MNSVGDEQKIVAAILRAWQICGSETPLHRGAVVDDVDVDVSVVAVVVVAVVVVVLVLLLVTVVVVVAVVVVVVVVAVVVLVVHNPHWAGQLARYDTTSSSVVLPLPLPLMKAASQ